MNHSRNRLCIKKEISTDKEIKLNADGLKINLTKDSPVKEKKNEFSNCEKTQNTKRLKKRGPKRQIYTCASCNKQLVGMSMYNYHMKKNHRVVLPTKHVPRKKSESKNRTYNCFVCNQKQKNMAQYKTHIKQIHRLNINLSSFSDCPICNVTVRRYNLDFHLKRNHQTTLSKFKHFSCPNCERIFTQFDDLMHHKRMDHEKSQNSNDETENVDANSSQQTRTRCLKRNRSFSTCSSLVELEKDRPFKCAYCQAAFTLKGNRTKHEEKFHPNQIIRTPHVDKNEGRKPANKILSPRLKSSKVNYPTESYTPCGVKIVHANHLFCNYCPKLFAHVHSKDLHEKIHTGNRPHLCSNCNASFRLPRTLSDHEKKCATLIDAIWCDFCDFNTKSRITLETHYNTSHGFQLNVYETLSRERNSNSRSNNMDITRQENDDTEISEERFSIKDEAKISFVVEDEDKDHWSQFIIDDKDEY